VLDVTGDFPVNCVQMWNLQGLKIVGRGSLIGVAQTATASVLDVRNVSNFKALADWYINGNYNTHYSQAASLYAGAAGEAVSYCVFDNVSFVNAPWALKVGCETVPSAKVSEIQINNIMTNGCPSGVLAVGTQTVVSLNAGTLESSVGSGNAAWQALAQQTLVAKGATVSRIGGELLHTTLNTGNANDSMQNTLIQLQPMLDSSGNAICGNVSVTGGTIETAAPMATTANLMTGSPAASEGGLIVIGVRGVSTGPGTAFFVAADGTFTGKIRVRECDFFAPSGRTAGNIYAGNSGARIYSDYGSWGAGFTQGASGFVGGTQVING
jgi:hypothetical protein